MTHPHRCPECHNITVVREWRRQRGGWYIIERCTRCAWFRWLAAKPGTEEVKR